MEELLEFLEQYGTWPSIIALASIFILGLLKYNNVFAKYNEKTRHTLYLLITVGLSATGSISYLAVVGQLTATHVTAITGAIFALNQTFYSIYSNLDLKGVFTDIKDFFVSLISKNKDKKDSSPIQKMIKGEGEKK